MLRVITSNSPRSRSTFLPGRVWGRIHEGRIMRKAVLTAASLAILWLGGEAAAEQSGIAAVYSYRGGRTASGEHSNPGALTAAHRSLPFGSKVLVMKRRNGRTPACPRQRAAARNRFFRSVFSRRAG